MTHKLILFILFVSIFFSVSTGSISARTNPLESSNNKHGIHIIDEHDLEEAAKLVNSNGGQWGYVTVVIPQTDRDVEKWQRIFDKMRRLKLIPIVRIATYADGPVWARPTQDEIASWVDFFDSLNWVVENRYIVLFNEPNHAQEWGGQLNPEEYSAITKVYANRLHDANEDYFVLPAGMDLAAGNTNETMSVVDYYSAIEQADPDYFTRFDGWTSHSYPNPNFSGSVHDTGRTSIRGFDWERDYLEQYGLPQTLPIFITETGWAHREGTLENTSFYTSSEVANLYEIAYELAWNDPNIVMVSPFLLNYQDQPFDHFSWKKLNSEEYYPQHTLVTSILKTSGKPVQRDAAELTNGKTPLELTTNALVFVPVTIGNIGQKIWEEGNVHVQVSINNEPIAEVALGSLEPNQTSTIKVPVVTDGLGSNVLIRSEVFVEDNSVGASDTHEISVQDKRDSFATLLPIVKVLAQQLIIEPYAEDFALFTLFD